MTTAIEIAIGLALIFALGALVCSVVHESVAQIFKLRWKNLQAALSRMLESGDLADVMAHPLLKNVWDQSRKPTAIPTAVFARALTHAFAGKREVVGAQAQASTTDETLKGATLASVISSLSPTAFAVIASWPADVRQQIVPFIKAGAGEMDRVYAAAEDWFDQSMSSATDWYARQAHWLSILVACVFAVACNIDSLAIATTLSRQPAERAALEQMAEQKLKQYDSNPQSICPTPATAGDVEATKQCVEQLSFSVGDLVGWNDAVWAQLKTPRCVLMALGWLVSGLAMSLGARFWFDALSRLVSVRAGLDATSVSATKAK